MGIWSYFDRWETARHTTQPIWTCTPSYTTPPVCTCSVGRSCIFLAASASPPVRQPASPPVQRERNQQCSNGPRDWYSGLDGSGPGPDPGPDPSPDPSPNDENRWYLFNFVQIFEYRNVHKELCSDSPKTEQHVTWTRGSQRSQAGVVTWWWCVVFYIHSCFFFQFSTWMGKNININFTGYCLLSWNTRTNSADNILFPYCIQYQLRVTD